MIVSRTFCVTRVNAILKTGDVKKDVKKKPQKTNRKEAGKKGKEAEQGAGITASRRKAGAYPVRVQRVRGRPVFRNALLSFQKPSDLRHVLTEHLVGAGLVAALEMRPAS